MSPKDVDREVIDLYNDYVHSTLPRREFLSRLTRLVGGAAAATGVLAVLEPHYAQARQVAPDDQRLVSTHIEFEGPQGKVKAYVTHPKKLKKGEKLPGILVIHENRGLNEHIEDVARRAALGNTKGGYLAIAPDGLSVAGGAPADQEAARDLFAQQDPARIAGDVLAAVPWLNANARCNGKIGSVGFCYGGGLSLRAAIDTEGVDAAVCFYGKQLSADETKRLKVPVLLNYAGSDDRVNAGIADFRAALDAQGVPYSLNMYPGTQHGFHNDSSAARYGEAAARLAWSRTMEFFDTYLI